MGLLPLLSSRSKWLFACEMCGRRGWLVEEHDADIALPDLRTIIARRERAGSMSDPCGVYYVALKPN